MLIDPHLRERTANALMSLEVLRWLRYWFAFLFSSQDLTYCWMRCASVKGSPPVFIFCIRVRVKAQEQPDSINVSELGCPMKRRPKKFVGNVHIRLVPDEYRVSRFALSVLIAWCSGAHWSASFWFGFAPALSRRSAISE